MSELFTKNRKTDNSGAAIYTNDNSGDRAKGRKALEKIASIPMPPPIELAQQTAAEMRDIALAALAEPPRNCDIPLIVDVPVNNNADKAWIVFRRHNPDAYFDVAGLLRCIDWLLAPATEKGESDEQK